MNELIPIISQFDDATLRDLAGKTVVEAVKKSYRTNLQSVLAEIICLELGSLILDNREIRLNIIDVAKSDQIDLLAGLAGVDGSGMVAKATELHRFFKVFSVKKSNIFVDWLGLPDKYRKKVKQDTRRDSECISIRHGQEVKLKGYLHAYQKSVKDQIQGQLESPGSRVMVQMPTGAGKTYTALETMVDTLRSSFYSNFIVWIVNTNELAEQALQSFKDLWQVKGDREVDCFRLFNKFSPTFSDYPSGGVVFASYDIIESALKNPQDSKANQIKYLMKQTEYLIVDEAHSAIAETYQDCIQFFIKDNRTRLLGLSATPFRDDDYIEQQLLTLFNCRLISFKDDEKKNVSDPIRYLQNRKFLANIDVKTLESNVVCNEMDEQKVLKALASNPDRNEMIVKQIHAAVDAGDQTLVFACTKEHVIALYVLCKKEELKVGFIIGDVLQVERLDIIEAFKVGDLNVLINLDILSTGIDIPALDRLILTRPIKSTILYSQIVGRALRGPLNGGNERNTIVNVLDNIGYFPDLSLLFDSFSNAWENDHDSLL